MSGTLAFLGESLLTLEGAAPARRSRLQSLRASIVLAWRQLAEAIAIAPGESGSATPRAPVHVDPGQALPLPGRWAITTLDRMAIDDPLWPCKIALLRASIIIGSSQPSAPRAERHQTGQRGSAERSGARSAIDELPQPFGGAARAFREQLAHQLCSGASVAVIESMFAAEAELSPAERPLACWIPCLLGLESMRRHGRPDPIALPLLDFIAEHARQQLSKLPPSIATTWLVGRDRYEGCAARLLALLFMRRGISCYPWTSESPPKFGRFLLSRFGTDVPAGELPANCLGTADLLAVAQRNDALARAASLWGADQVGTVLSSAAG